MIKDILEHILEYISDEYDQYFFMSSCMDFWQMGVDWRKKYYTMNETLTIAPYMKRIMSDYSCDGAISIRIPDADIKTFSLLFANYIRMLDKCAVIIASGKEISKYIKFVNDAGLYNNDPELSQIVFTSYNIKSHYAYCKRIFDKKPYDVVFPKKIVITTFSYIGKILRLCKSYETVFTIFNELYGHREIYSYISIANEDGDYDIKTSVLTESIKPILNVRNAIGFTSINISNSISEHINKYGETYILSFRGYNKKFDGYENVIIRDDNDDPSINDIMKASLDPLADETRQPKLYWRIKEITTIVPINSIICIVNSYDSELMYKILNKKSKYSRTLNITFIRRRIASYVINSINNMFDKQFLCKTNDGLQEAYKMLAMIGIDLFALNNCEQFIVCYDIKSKHTNMILELWREQTDNKLTEDGIKQYLSIYI